MLCFGVTACHARCPTPFFFSLAWLEATSEGPLERGSHNLMLGPGDGEDPPLW